ncbi:MAG: Na-translocating system protein MpsC family protein [Solirubrobacteraceae bacterium]
MDRRTEAMLKEDDAEPDGAPGAPSLEISNAIARLHKQYVGRGPTTTRTTIDGDLVVCLMEGGYTRAEQTLERNDHADLVAAGRLGLQDAMGADMIEAVQGVLGRTVRSFMSANDLKRNLMVEVFVLAADGVAGIPPTPD